MAVTLVALLTRRGLIRQGSWYYGYVRRAPDGIG